MEKQMREPWKENASSFLVLYSILAATCGVFIVVIFTEIGSVENYWFIPLAILGISFWLFIFSAEGITDALDENDVHKYFAVILLYNIAVILLISGISSMIYLKYIHRNSSSFIVLILLVLVFVCHWLTDTCHMIFDSNNVHKDYIESLTNGNKIDGKRKRRMGWTTFFLCLRKQFHGKPS